jgi:hypothetical protein
MGRTGWIFLEDTKNIQDCRTHVYSTLIKIAGMHDLLITELRTSASRGGTFHDNWRTAEHWHPRSRYQPQFEPEANALYAAISDVPDGVLPSIKKHW